MYLLWFLNNSRSKLKSPSSDIDPICLCWHCSHSSRHLPLLPFCSVSFCFCFFGKRPFWQCWWRSGHIKSGMTRAISRMWVCVMGSEWKYEIPFRPQGLAGSAACVREIIKSVYTLDISAPLSFTLTAPLSVLNLFSPPLAVLIFEGLIIYFLSWSCLLCSLKLVSSGLTEALLHQHFETQKPISCYFFHQN